MAHSTDTGPPVGARRPSLSIAPPRPLMKTLHTLLGATLLAIALPMSASAQTAAATASVTVGDILSISISGATANFGTVTAGGYASTADQTVISHAGNIAHTVQVKADASHFTSGSGTNNTALPAGRLEWSDDGGSTWTAFTTTDAAIHASAAAGDHANDETIDYQLDIDVLDPNDTYTLGLTYSVISG